MDYDDVVVTLMTMCEVPLNQSDDNFQRVLPAMFLDADGRIYRDLTFLTTQITQPVQLIARNRELALPANVRALRAINVCTPFNVPLGPSSRRKPLERISPESLDFFWPQSSFQPAMPQKYAIIGSMTPVVPGVPASPSLGTPAVPPQPQVMSYLIRFMPTPDQNYPAELLGDIRPDPLSPDNPQTYLTVTYPELFLAACMIFAAGYQRDFGAQADDPARAASWEQHYANVRSGIMGEAARMRGEAAGNAAAAQPGTP